MNNIKIYTLIAFSFLFSFLNAVVYTYTNLSSFNKVELVGDFSVSIIQSDTSYLRVQSSPNFRKHNDIHIQNSTLRIAVNDNSHMFDYQTNILIALTNLSQLTSSGSSKIEIRSDFSSSNLKVNLNGAAEFSTNNLLVDFFTLITNGTGQITLNGNAKTTTLEINGASEIDAIHFKSQNTKVTIAGVGEASVNAENLLDIDISGPGTVNYYGNPRLIKKEAGYLGEINQLSEQEE